MTTIDIGWGNTWPQAAFAFPKPRLLEDDRLPPALRGRIVELRCAIDATLRYDPSAANECALVEGSRLRRAGFEGMVTGFAGPSRRRPDVPVVQIALNIFFVTDAECSLILTPAWLAEGPRRWPGPMVGGRFPFRSWPRPLNLAIEWEDRDRDWVLARGEPVAYVQFDLPDPESTVRLVEAASTPGLSRHRKAIDNVSSVTRNVQPMFLEAARRRPASLLTPKDTR